jgi:hypothetical protein
MPDDVLDAEGAHKHSPSIVRTGANFPSSRPFARDGFRACKIFHDADQRTPEIAIGYAIECRDQLQRVPIFKDVEQAGRLKAGLA